MTVAKIVYPSTNLTASDTEKSVLDKILQVANGTVPETPSSNPMDSVLLNDAAGGDSLTFVVVTNSNWPSTPVTGTFTVYEDAAIALGPVSYTWPADTGVLIDTKLHAVTASQYYVVVDALGSTKQSNTVTAS